MRTPLLSRMDLTARQELGPRFSQHTFSAGEPVLRSGDAGRHLGVVIDGTVTVQARKDDQAYVVDRLQAGAIFGEIAFFDAASVRTADIVGETAGSVALLPWSAYQDMAHRGDPAAEVLEKAVLDLLTKRIQNVNANLADLLEATRDGSWMAALRRFIGIRS
jgi:CRP-like cAMP-binding protein